MTNRPRGYTPKFTKDAVENIKLLPKNVKNALKTAITNKLSADPVGASTGLREELSEFRSFHWRNYRVVFKIDEELKALAIAGVGKKEKDPDHNLYRRLEAAAEQGQLAEQVLRTLKGLR